jgi:bleomycin hydrolase
LVDFLGEPPVKFNWRYKSKKNKNVKESIKCSNDHTPIDFYKTMVEYTININNFVCIINDPRNPYDRHYTVDYLNNMTNGAEVLYLNKPMGTLISLCKSSVDQDMPVWFGSDVTQYTSKEKCICGMDFFDYPTNMNKKQRLLTFDSTMTHAMLVHGYDFEEVQEETSSGKWKLENSWGNSGPYDGYYIADNKWFENYVYQICIHKSIVEKKEIETEIKDDIIHLPPWDAFGGLSGKSEIKKTKYIINPMYLYLNKKNKRQDRIRLYIRIIQRKILIRIKTI